MTNKKRQCLLVLLLIDTDVDVAFHSFEIKAEIVGALRA
jgi:hypothetical protein